MSLRSTSISAIAVLAMSSGAALAQTDTNQNFCDTGYFSADGNADGAVDRDELQKVTEAEFSSLDADNDGMVTMEEYADCRGAWMRQAPNVEPMSDADITTMDTNQDGSIDQDEYMQRADQEYMARWGETGTEREVRDADFAPVTPENMGGPGNEEALGEGDDQTGASTQMQEDAQTTQADNQQTSDTSDTAAATSGTATDQGASDTQAAASGAATDESTSDTQAAASDAVTDQTPSDAQDAPRIVLRRIIFLPQGDQRSPGEMSREELAHRAALQFLLLDANRNQVIDPDEQKGGAAEQARMDEMLNKQFDRADTDKSGDLSREEYTADTQARWQRAQDRRQATGEDVGAPVVYYRYPHPF